MRPARLSPAPEAEHETFNRLGYTIGGMMVFPGNKVGGARTINGERGCNSLIDDRFDLTVECIRRHYLGEPSPLSDTLARYPDFFVGRAQTAGCRDVRVGHPCGQLRQRTKPSVAARSVPGVAAR
jgi:Family of unknown function (DUF6994)